MEVSKSREKQTHKGDLATSIWYDYIMVFIPFIIVTAAFLGLIVDINNSA